VAANPFEKSSIYFSYICIIIRYLSIYIVTISGKMKVVLVRWVHSQTTVEAAGAYWEQSCWGRQTSPSRCCI